MTLWFEATTRLYLKHFLVNFDFGIISVNFCCSFCSGLFLPIVVEMLPVTMIFRVVH